MADFQKKRLQERETPPQHVKDLCDVLHPLKEASLMLGYLERRDSIHWADRLSGLIIVRVVYIVESFLDLVDTPAAAGISFESGN